MTSPIIPDFILKMFEQEVTKINIIIVDKICDLYDLDIDEVKQQLSDELDMNFNVINDNIEQIKVIKKHNAKPDASTLDKSTLCIARVFIQSELKVKQCSRHKLDGQNFCKLHLKLHQNNTLKYGTIHDQKPDEISTEKLNRKVKRNIY